MEGWRVGWRDGEIEGSAIWDRWSRIEEWRGLDKVDSHIVLKLPGILLAALPFPVSAKCTTGRQKWMQIPKMLS